MTPTLLDDSHMRGPRGIVANPLDHAPGSLKKLIMPLVTALVPFVMGDPRSVPGA